MQPSKWSTCNMLKELSWVLKVLLKMQVSLAHVIGCICDKLFSLMTVILGGNFFVNGVCDQLKVVAKCFFSLKPFERCKNPPLKKIGRVHVSKSVITRCLSQHTMQEKNICGFLCFFMRFSTIIHKKFPQMFTANVLCIQTSDVECCWCHLFKTAISYRRETKLETNCFEIERFPTVHYSCCC